MLMSGETCGVLSQLVPVLLLALVVEWRRGFLASVQSDELQPALWVLGGNVVLFGAVEALVVIGVQAKGLDGFWGVTAWLGSAFLLLTTLANIIFGLVRSTGRGTQDPW
jgi:hypothetical protein